MFSFPNMRHVPDVARLESACRRAGEIPRSHKDRTHQHRAVMRLVKEMLRKGKFHGRELQIFGDYQEGKFDLKGRPPKPLEQQWRLLDIAQQVEAIESDEKLHRDAALRVFLTTNPRRVRVTENGRRPRWVSSDDDPDDEVFSFLKDYLKR
jgi:hypothetical protein